MKSILIVEGNHIVADLFTTLFVLEQWTVTTFHDGLLAEEALRCDTHYDAVLLSSRLGVISGVQLIERIRALHHRQRIPIIMVTGSLHFDVGSAALVAGADEVLHKPGHVPTLVEVVQKHVEMRARGRFSIA